MRWLVHQEEHHEIDHASRVLPLLKIGRLRITRRSSNEGQDARAPRSVALTSGTYIESRSNWSGFTPMRL
jgi:hypothetical protein